jgi:uroporphyrinogen decarboxylase
MNPKENALRTIRFDNPAYIMRDPPGLWLSYTGCNHEGYQGGGHHLPVGSTWTDIWKTGWRREQEGVMGFPVIHPLEDLPRTIRTYAWPDPDDERICAKIYQNIAEWDKENSFLVGQHRDTLWEKAYMLVGMENLMVYFKTEPQAVHELLSHIMDFQVGIARHYLKAGVELVECGDDLGGQKGLLLSPGIIHEFFIPQYRRLFSIYKSNQIFIEFHSCGQITALIDDFIDLGIDILNPVQATANNLDLLREKTNGRLALHGGVNSALVVSGPIEAIEAEVQTRILQLDANGGYFCGPDQGMPWPAEHEKAMEKAITIYGKRN